jgi:hypothetical protein
VVVCGALLPAQEHFDGGSLITMDVMLADPAGGDFKGGDFTTYEADGTMLRHPFEKGDLLIFQVRHGLVSRAEQ